MQNIKRRLYTMYVNFLMTNDLTDQKLVHGKLYTFIFTHLFDMHIAQNSVILVQYMQRRTKRFIALTTKYYIFLKI